MSWNIERAKMWSLGHFKPEGPVDANRLLDWIQERVAARHVLVRHPSHCQSMFNTYDETCDNYDPLDDVTLWHHDGTESFHKYLGIWSNTHSTEVRVAPTLGIWPAVSDEIYQAEPGEFVLIHNQFFEHRCPEGLSKRQMKSRWFARFDTGGPVRDHPDVKVCVL